MPTVILLDASLSMFRPISPPTQRSTPSTPSSGSMVPSGSDTMEERTFMSLAVIGINAFLDNLSSNCKMEFVSLVLFSSLYEQVVGFTKDYSDIRAALTRIESYNKTCVESALKGVGSLVVEEWGLSASTQILLVTDGSPGVGEGSLPHTVQNLKRRLHGRGGDMDRRGGPAHDDPATLFPFSFSSKLHIMCLTDSTDPVYQSSLPLYRQLVNLSSAEPDTSSSNGSGVGGEERLGGVMAVEGTPTPKSVRRMFSRLAKKQYPAYHSTLMFGNLRCQIRVFPPLESYDGLEEFKHVTRTPGDSIEMVGFIDIKDIASPPHISRHILLPVSPTHNNDAATKSSQDVKMETTGDLDRETMAERTPTLTVVLHGGLKNAGTVALATVAPDWYGMIYSLADGKKKSNLILSLFKPGTDVLPWLGRLDRLAPLAEVQPPPLDVTLPPESTPQFPVHLPDKKSYNQNSIVWIKGAGLQADIQKVLRNAKRLPEKHVTFYKELNRLRRAALSLGFYELLITMAQLLERECKQLPSTAHPDVALQMNHAASVLKSGMACDAAFTIQPLRTNFSLD